MDMVRVRFLDGRRRELGHVLAKGVRRARGTFEVDARARALKGQDAVADPSDDVTASIEANSLHQFAVEVANGSHGDPRGFETISYVQVADLPAQPLTRVVAWMLGNDMIEEALVVTTVFANGAEAAARVRRRGFRVIRPKPPL